MLKKKKPESIASLGIFVSPNSVTGVLTRPVDTTFEVIGRFVRTRDMEGSFDALGNAAGVIPGLKTGDDADYTLQMGAGAEQDGGFFLSTELPGGLGGGGKSQSGEGGTSVIQQKASPPFLTQFHDILAECKAAGYSHPRVAFCITAPDVSYVPLPLGEIGKKGGMEVYTGPLSKSKRKQLLGILPQYFNGRYEDDRVDFLPMMPAFDNSRYLAVVPDTMDSVITTLDLFVRQDPTEIPDIQIVDTELSVLQALVAQSPYTEEGQSTALVRVGSDDTLLVFFAGSRLQHVERMRSVTAYDPPETICSRVMLQQDEQKIGDLDTVLLVADSRGRELIESFRDYYPNAVVEHLQKIFEDDGREDPVFEEHLGGAMLTALTTSLRLTQGWDTAGVPLVNLMPKRLKRRTARGRVFSWHTVAMLVVLFGVAAYFVTEFQANQEMIEDRREELLANPPAEPLTDPAILQARVDSLQRTYQQYTQALRVLDSLLIGSDRWSRFLEQLSQTTGELGGVWIRSMDSNGGSVSIDATALSRNKAAAFARRINGSVERLSSLDVADQTKDVRVYNFTIAAQAPAQMPEVAQYLQEMAVIDDEPLLAGQDDQMPEDYEATPITDAVRRRAQEASTGGTANQ